MRRSTLVLALGCATAAGCVRDATPNNRPTTAGGVAEPAWAPTFNAAGQLVPPIEYRSWTFLTSGFGMNYGPAAVDGIKQHDNVFVRPEVYQQFVATGAWPEHALFVLEIRSPESEGSINHGGQFQTDLVGIEAELKDTARFAATDGWGFFAFDTDESGPSAPATVLAEEAPCYSCHATNAAVENTFTQFYPTLFPIARAKGTVRADFAGMPATQREVVAAAIAGGWPAAEQLLADTATRWPTAAVIDERAINLIGYRLLGAGKRDAAIAAFEHVTRAYPASANAWDSLSEAYEGAGRADDARRAVETGLRVFPADAGLVGDRRDALEQSLRDRAARLSAH